MADVWATFGKGMFVVLAVAGGVWIGRGGQLPLAELAPQRHSEQLFHGRDDAPRTLGTDNHPRPVAQDNRHPDLDQSPSHDDRPGREPNRVPYQNERHRPSHGEPQFRSQLEMESESADRQVALSGDAVPALAPILLAAATAPPDKPVIAKLVNDGVHYSVRDFHQGIWLRGTSGLRVHLSSGLAAGQELILVAQNAPTIAIVGESSDVNRQIWSFGAKDPSPITTAGMYNVQSRLTGNPSNPSQLSTSFLLHIASATNPPQINAWSGNQYRPPSNNTFDNPLRVPGGYLRLQGGAAPGAAVHIIAEAGSTGSFAPTNQAWSARADGQGLWNAELKLPALGTPNAKGRLWAYTESADVRAYAANPIAYESTAAGTSAIQLNGIAVESTKPGSFANPLKTNSRTVHVFFESQDKLDPNTDLVVLKVGNSLRTQVNNSTAETGPITWNIPSEGRHSVKLAIIRGDQEIAESPETVVVDFRQTGPKALNVELVNPLKTPQATVIRVAFDPASPLVRDPDPKLFELTLSGVAPEGVTLTPRWMASENVVQLTASKVLEAGSYTLTVKHQESGKQLVDAFGNLLGASAENRDGSSTTFSFFKSAGTELPTQSRGLSGITGPNIEYKEYTDRRNIPEGFNPSDKVVTRVARLYYYRDAHRVVQLLNRTARSYNRQAVDQQQQLADNALRDAQDATTNRRISEQEAVRAAQKARAAESALNQAQAGLVQAQAASQVAQDGIPPLDSQIAAQQRAIADIQAQQSAAEQQLSNVGSAPTTEQLDAAQARLRTAQQTLNNLPADASADAQGTAEQELADAQAALTTLQAKQRNHEQAVANLNAAKSQSAAADTRLIQLQEQRAELVRQQTEASARLENSRRLVDTALGEVQASRQEEVRLTDNLMKLEAKEERDFRTLFIREVAAATADPDTYAPGNPKSDDPIAQVSLSVIGEGEIQLRGPLKGVNLARTLINQIDAPVGQVRVAIHTIQVNGERGERMEPVVERIQRYVDHSRFLTSQSAQMLRHAVTNVAAQRAEAVFAACEGLSQHERDEKYLHAFFGKEFIHELLEMDSEFLRTGNKLLSLHSMDSTSLAQALFLLALAKNDVRMEILQEFERLTTCNLPQDELDYFTASNAAFKFGPPLHKQKFQFMGHSARFVSLKGYFNAEINGPDTITPMQREFIRLAQIFKSRLVSEREIIQRVMERSLIEDRFADYAQALREAQERENASQQRLRESTQQVVQSQLQLAEVLSLIRAEAAAIGGNATTAQENAEYLNSFYVKLVNSVVESTSQNGKAPMAAEIDQLREQLIQLPNDFMRAQQKALSNSIDVNQYTRNRKSSSGASALSARDMSTALPSGLRTKFIDFTEPVNAGSISGEIIGSVEAGDKLITVIIVPSGGTMNYRTTLEDLPLAKKILRHHNGVLRDIDGMLDSFRLHREFLTLRSEAQVLMDSVSQMLSENDVNKFDPLRTSWTISHASMKYKDIFEHVAAKIVPLIRAADVIVADIDVDRTGSLRVAEQWSEMRDEILRWADGELRERAANLIDQVDLALSRQVDAVFLRRTALRQAEDDRRPLDHKKFLDMLVDDSEDKYIEILEGTRAHTANVDNYLARIITALDDDFNTQFYNPTFKHVREAGRYWDVQMGQIETTTVLTNNRTFAKVSPQAMMEFDLPKRDILISEAFESAAAAYQDYGALLHDPTFLSLTKMYRGQPTSAVYDGGMPNPLVRDVLPGLPSSTNEQLMIQQGATAPDFPSALESLIPDPAIYKFETGTGFEIRPVIQPDGQAVVFHLNYMYTTNLREPVRADEKHLGRIKRHFVDTDVTLGNFELREVSKYTVALKASRTARGVPLLEDVPVAGILFRPLPQQQSSLQQNLILSQATIFPTLFDLMGLRWAPAIADLGVDELKELDFVTRNRRQELQNRVFDVSSGKVDEFLQVPDAERRKDLYRPQHQIPREHPNGDVPRGLDLQELIPVEGDNFILPDSAGTSSTFDRPGQGIVEELAVPPPSPSLGEIPAEIVPQSYVVPQQGMLSPNRMLPAPRPSRPIPRERTAPSADSSRLSNPPPQSMPENPGMSVPPTTPDRKTSARHNGLGQETVKRSPVPVEPQIQPVIRSQSQGDHEVETIESNDTRTRRWKFPTWKRER